MEGSITSVTWGCVLRRRAKGWPIPPYLQSDRGYVGGREVLTSSSEDDSLDHCEPEEGRKDEKEKNATIDRVLYFATRWSLVGSDNHLSRDTRSTLAGRRQNYTLMSLRALRLRPSHLSLDAHRCTQHAALVSRPPPSVSSPPSYVYKFIARHSAYFVCSARRRRRPAPTTLRPPVSELARRVESLAVSVNNEV